MNDTQNRTATWLTLDTHINVRPIKYCNQEYNVGPVGLIPIQTSLGPLVPTRDAGPSRSTRVNFDVDGSKAIWSKQFSDRAQSEVRTEPTDHPTNQKSN
jgi:hypothetical protein